jgi:hypothetical protein
LAQDNEKIKNLDYGADNALLKKPLFERHALFSAFCQQKGTSRRKKPLVKVSDIEIKISYSTKKSFTKGLFYAFAAIHITCMGSQGLKMRDLQQFSLDILVGGGAWGEGGGEPTRNSSWDIQVSLQSWLGLMGLAIRGSTR